MRQTYLQTPGGNPARDQRVDYHAEGELFRSYGKPVAMRVHGEDTVYIDPRYWDYSQTTTRYLGQYLSDATTKVNKKIIEQRLANGEYVFKELGGVV